MKLKKWISVLPVMIFSIFYYKKSFAYSEGLLTASGTFAPSIDLQTSYYQPRWGANLKVDVMNNAGFDLGLGYNWLVSNRWFDLRTIYWINNHMNGFYFGLQGHAQYYPKFGAGGGGNIGYSLPLTDYFNLTFDADAGYGTKDFFESAYNHVYFISTIGISYSFM